jgi:hypothetical protein
MAVEPFMRVQSRLTDRDHFLLGWLADHGVLTSFQIAHALYPSLDFAQRRLRKLCDTGLISRFRPFRADGGTYPYHYVLDQLGVEIVASHRGDELPRKNQARKRRWHLTTRANLPHLLGTNQFFIDLAGHARAHPEAALLRWWPAARCQEAGAFAEKDDDMQMHMYRPRSRPDGHGIWTETNAVVPFFLEFDTGTEDLGRLVDKIDGYEDLARVTRRSWPVLFWLHSAVRERHLQQRLAEYEWRVLIATAARDDATHTSRCPADAVWWVHRYNGGLLRLADLAPTVTDALPKLP